MVKIIIDPLANIYYAGFYIHGLIQKYGKKAIVFADDPFKGLVNRGMNFNFLVIKEGNEKKYTINFDDSYKIKEDLYDWCDVYGNVNANFQKTPIDSQGKMISMAPSFGIRLWNFPFTCYYAFSNLYKSQSHESLRKFLGKYKRQYYLRSPYKAYRPISTVEKNYVFHLSTLWYNDEWNKNDERVNLSRFYFIKVCKEMSGLNFEGGLVTNEGIKVNPDFEQALTDKRVTVKEYLRKTKSSIFVFNTPAFWLCHGWKLAEYLALGKAIISTPLFNDLPSPLIHGEHIHYVENTEESIKEAVVLLSENSEYRKKLEQGAREYWEKYGTPECSLALLGV